MGTQPQNVEGDPSFASQETPIPTRERRLNEERKRLEKGLPRKKGKPRTLGVRYMSTLQLDIVTSECLKIAAWQRHVSVTSLLSDILGLWVWVACDFEQDIYRSRIPVGVRPMAVPERWLGYLASLGFKKALEEQARAYAQQEAIVTQQESCAPAHVVPPPVEQQAKVSPPEPVAPPPPPAAREDVPDEQAMEEAYEKHEEEQRALRAGSPFQAPLHRMAQPRPGEVPVQPVVPVEHTQGYGPPDEEDLRREPPPGPDDFPLPMNARGARSAGQDPL